MDLDFITAQSGQCADAGTRRLGAFTRPNRTRRLRGGLFRATRGRIVRGSFLLRGRTRRKDGKGLPDGSSRRRGVAAAVEATPGLAITESKLPEGLNGVSGRSVFGTTFFPHVYVRKRVRLGAQLDGIQEISESARNTSRPREPAWPGAR